MKRTSYKKDFQSWKGMTDRLYRVFSLFRYTGSGIRLGNEQINYRQGELGKLFNVSIIQNIASCPSLKNIHQWRASFKNSMLLW